MTDERTEVRSLLDAVSADLPPTRLTVEGICAEARRRRARRWLPTRPRSRPRSRSISLPSGRAVLQALALAVAVAALPGLITLALLRDSSGNETSASSGGVSAPVPDVPHPPAAAPRAGSAGQPLAGVLVLDAGVVVELATDHRTLSVTVRVGACHGPLELRAVSRRAVVEITATEDARGPADSAGCPASLVSEMLTARLDQPLGSRPIVDGRTGRAMAILDRLAVRPS